MSTNVIHTDDRGFEAAVLQAKVPVLVDFWAPWCGPCRMIAPIVAELAAEYSGRLRVVKVNTDDSPNVMSRYGVMSIPSLVFFKDGKEAHRVVGAWPKAKLTAAVQQVLAATPLPIA
jgi:thioredoxin 1